MDVDDVRAVAIHAISLYRSAVTGGVSAVEAEIDAVAFTRPGMAPDDVQAVGGYAIGVYRAAITSGLGDADTELFAVANTIITWPITKSGQLIHPPDCMTEGCEHLAAWVVVDGESKYVVCRDCMLDLTEYRRHLPVFDLTGEPVDMSED